MYYVAGLKSKNEYAKFLQGDTTGKDIAIDGISFDSRTVKKNELFIPLEGKNFSGSSFVDEAIRKGAVVLSNACHSNNCIQVEDVYSSLIMLCQKHIEELGVKLILITGSYGKTTIKEMLRHSIGSACHTNKLNENNEFGIPFTILSCNPHSDYLVVECGARNIGDFDYLAEHLKSDVFILTDVAAVHLETFRTIKNIEKTKLTLKKTLKEKSIFIDGRKLNHLNYQEKNNHIVESVISKLDIATEKNINSYQPSAGRGKIIKIMGGSIIDQTYNSSPSTLIATVTPYSNKNTSLILGDMAELGESQLDDHVKVLDHFHKYKVWVTGPIFKQAITKTKSKNVNYFENEKEFPTAAFRLLLQNNENLYFKGSRSSKMERFIKLLLND
ncbi:MAG: hypothetical protein ISQ61_00115 [SAR86 cluster bacterium]|uniref:UDP-N-acetylmuramoyl-tripeptide--D-alanyl-D-alanine ligase n=1 Tax=SAR86 cluster bacterium TaxID=2030880 RepID=A0A937LMQ1_9GAMM|nr:hypothetical protein [SAR86 cluster bacterium]